MYQLAVAVSIHLSLYQPAWVCLCFKTYVTGKPNIAESCNYMKNSPVKPFDLRC